MVSMRIRRDDGAEWAKGLMNDEAMTDVRMAMMINT